jgi:hypothetical protein
VAGVAFLYSAVSARERTRHQKLRALGEKEGGAETDEGQHRQQDREAISQ